MSKFLGVEPLGSLNVIKFRHIFTGVNALLLILGQPVDIGHRYVQKISCGNSEKRLRGMSNVEI